MAPFLFLRRREETRTQEGKTCSERVEEEAPRLAVSGATFARGALVAYTDGRPHVAYRADAGAIKYAVRVDGTWMRLSPPEGLDGFLRLSANSHSREVLFRHRLCYELKAAAAMAGYHLHVFLPDVDHGGFDLVCGDRERLHRVQLKTVLADSTTRILSQATSWHSGIGAG